VLPNLPFGLIDLYCNNNELQGLPNLPNSLAHLCCYNNKLTFLPKLPNNLQNLICSNNKLTFLPIIQDSLKYKDYYNNPVFKYIQTKCGGNIKIYHRENDIFATKLVNWYLDCRENPKFKFCRDRINREYDALMEEDVDGIMS